MTIDLSQELCTFVFVLARFGRGHGLLVPGAVHDRQCESQDNKEQDAVAVEHSSLDQTVWDYTRHDFYFLYKILARRRRSTRRTSQNSVTAIVRNTSR